MTEEPITTIEEMLACTDELALETFIHGSPSYELQQALIRNAARYRLSQRKSKNEKL